MTTTMRTARKNTREELLDAAEQLFARHGVESTSVRMIVAEAGVNVAAISFHFGSLVELQRQVLRRRFTTLVERRLAGLRALQSNPTPPTASQILQAWLAPMFALAGSADAGEVAFVQVLARSLSGPAGDYAQAVRDEFVAHKDAFVAAWRKALPHLSADELRHRLRYALGAYTFALAQIPHTAGDQARRRAVQRVQTQLFAFIEGGLLAPSAP